LLSRGNILHSLNIFLKETLLLTPAIFL
jgi:hypothetical protein